MRSMCSLVDILGEDTELPVECQGELCHLRKITAETLRRDLLPIRETYVRVIP